MLFHPLLKSPKPQKLHQKSERDCGVCVFAELAGVSEEEVCGDLPDAHLGTVSVDGWKQWLQEKGFTVLQREGCPDDIVPCAHLVAHVMYSPNDAHWVYRDSDGDVHDPSEDFVPADDQRMRNLLFYSEKILTLSLSR